MRRLTPEEEIDIEVMAKKPEYACDILIANRKFHPDYRCKVWEALRSLWEDREILIEHLNEAEEGR
jgi:hypothetical protein